MHFVFLDQRQWSSTVSAYKTDIRCHQLLIVRNLSQTTALRNTRTNIAMQNSKWTNSNALNIVQHTFKSLQESGFHPAKFASNGPKVLKKNKRKHWTKQSSCHSTWREMELANWRIHHETSDRFYIRCLWVYSKIFRFEVHLSRTLNSLHYSKCCTEVHDFVDASIVAKAAAA